LLANPTIAKLESAKKISKEIATRQKDLGKNAKSELVELRKQVKAEIDSIEDMELLADLLAQLRS
jgi:predicted DNA-binding protein